MNFLLNKLNYFMIFNCCNTTRTITETELNTIMNRIIFQINICFLVRIITYIYSVSFRLTKNMFDNHSKLEHRLLSNYNIARSFYSHP